MVKLIAILLSIQIIFLPAFVYADSIPKITAVKRGQKAPYAGSLLNPTAVAKILADKQAMKERCAADLKYAKNRCNLLCSKDKTLIKTKCDITEKKLNKIISIKNDQIEKTEAIAIKAAKNNNPWLWGTIGAAVGIAATIGVVFLVRGVSD